MKSACLVVAVSAVLVGGLLSACGDGSTSQSGGSTLTVVTPATPEGIDHDAFYNDASQQVRTFLYDNLLGYSYVKGDANAAVPNQDPATLEGRLAESWSMSGDGLTLTLKLRQGVMSHAGNELTAQDVQYTWDRGWAIEGSSKFYAGVDLGITEPSWQVVDKYTWKISVPKPNSLLIPMMANNDLNIYDSVEMKKHVTGSDPWAKEWAASNDAGFGPYKLEKWSPGNEVVVTAFNKYYRGEPHYKKIVYKEIADGSNRASLVTTGSAALAERLPYNNLSKLASDSRQTLWATRGNRTMKLMLQNKDPKFADPRVRLAVNYVVDREALSSGVFFNLATPMTTVLPANTPGATSAYAYARNVAKSKQLLAEAGFPNGFDMTLDYDTSLPDNEPVAVALKSQLSAIGIKVSLNPASPATFTDKFFGKKYQAALYTEWPIIQDAGYTLALVYPCGGGFNQTQYCDEKVTQLIDEGLVETDSAARDKIYGEAQRIMMTQNPADAPLVEPGWRLLTNASVKNVAWLPWQSWDPFQLS